MKTDKLTKQQNIVDALGRFADYIKNTSDGALIVEATIVEVIDEGVGEYSVEYFGNTFSVYSTNRDVSYSVGDNVYISVPERNFSKTKLIIGLSNPQTATFTDDNNDQTVYTKQSANFIENSELLGTIQMCSYHSPTEVTLDLCPDDYLYKVTYLQDFGSHHLFSLSCKVKTELPPEQQNSGAYGIILSIPVEVNAATGGTGTTLEWKHFALDTTNMLGNFYRFDEWVTQKIYFSLDEQYTVSQEYYPTLTYYCRDFNQKASATKYDIFIKDIELYGVGEVALTESGYGLVVEASEGNKFGSCWSSIKTLTPKLVYKGKNVKLTSDNCEIYWFKENVEVRGSHEDYNNYGGNGWQCLNPKTNIAMDSDGSQTFSWITNLMTLDVPSTDVLISLRYKCVVIYKGMQLSFIIELIQAETNSIFTLTAKDGNIVLMKDTGYAYLIATVHIDDVTTLGKELSDAFRNDIIYSWARYDKNGNYINDDGDFFEIVRYNEVNEQTGSFETEIKYPVNMIEGINYIYCSATYIDNNLVRKPLGTRSVGLSTTTLYEYNLFINNDDIIYKYDTNGDSPAGTAYDGPSTSKVKDIAPLNYTIKKASGEDFTGEEYRYVYFKWTIPKDSMFIIKSSDYEDASADFSEDDENYYIQGYDNFEHNAANLIYTIRDRFNLSQTDVSISLEVTFKDRTLERYASIGFIKEGMNGTNGTAYAARLVSGGINPESSVSYGAIIDGIPRKLKFIYNISDNTFYYYDYDLQLPVAWGDPNHPKKKIYPLVYENSRLMVYNQNVKEYNIEYSMFDKAITKPCLKITSVDENGGVTLDIDPENPPTLEDNNVPCNILQAKITVIRGNYSVANANEIIYVYYPIEFTFVNYMTVTWLPAMDGGFAEVMYATDGTNPSWDQTSPFVIRDNRSKQVTDYCQVEWEAQYHIHTANGVDLSEKPIEVSLVPDNKYDDGNSKNYVMATVTLNPDKINDLEEEITTLAGEIQEDQDKIDKANANYNYLDTFAAAFNYRGWMTSLDTSAKPILDIRTNMYNCLKDIQKAINNFDDYLRTQDAYGDSRVTTVCTNLGIISDKNTLQTQIVTARDKILKLGTGQHYTIDDLVSLDYFQIRWDDTIQGSLISELGINIEVNLELLIKDINQATAAYQKYFDRIESREEKGNYEHSLEAYNFIKYEIYSACQNIPETIYPRYVSITNKVLRYLELFDTVTSVKEVKNLINSMVVDALGVAFTLQKNGILIVSEATTNEINQYKIYYISKQTIEDIRKEELEALDSIKEQYGLVHIRPIVIYLNRYSMSNINAWDGNKIDTGDGSYLLAPQVGAGIKEQDNSFTGVVIGQRNLGANGIGEAQLGLFGYCKGAQSIFLNAENGSAIFGLSGPISGQTRTGGQIIIDPTHQSALLYNSGYWNQYDNKTGLPSNYSIGNQSGNGMCINLSDGYIHFGSAADGKIYSGTHSTVNSGADGFYLSHDGISIGSHFSISTNGTLGSTSGHIAGWTISADMLQGGSTKLKSNGTIECVDLIAHNSGDIAGWEIDGTTLSKGSTILNGATGEITCKSGNIGGFNVSATSLSNPSGTLLISSGDGSIGGNNGSGQTWLIDGNFGNGYVIGAFEAGSLSVRGVGSVAIKGTYPVVNGAGVQIGSVTI